jgi:hypothetical protein
MDDGSAEFPRDASGRFGPGNPGRPRGSRNRMTNQLALALLDDFSWNEEENLKRLRRWFFPQYVQLMSRFLPRETRPARPDFADYTPEETARVTAAARAALARIERGEAGLDALMAVLERDPASLETGPETAPAEETQDISKPVEYGESTAARPPGSATADGGWLKIWGAAEG